MDFIDFVLDKKIKENQKSFEQLQQLLAPFGIIVNLRDNILTIGSRQEEILRKQRETLEEKNLN